MYLKYVSLKAGISTWFQHWDFVIQKVYIFPMHSCYSTTKQNNQNMITWQSRIHAYVFDYTSRIQQVYNDWARISANSWAYRGCSFVLHWILFHDRKSSRQQQSCSSFPLHTNKATAQKDGHNFQFRGTYSDFSYPIIGKFSWNAGPFFLHVSQQNPNIELAVKCILVYCLD